MFYIYVKHFICISLLDFNVWFNHKTIFCFVSNTARVYCRVLDSASICGYVKVYFVKWLTLMLCDVWYISNILCISLSHTQTHTYIYILNCNKWIYVCLHILRPSGIYVRVLIMYNISQCSVKISISSCKPGLFASNDDNNICNDACF